MPSVERHMNFMIPLINSALIKFLIPIAQSLGFAKTAPQQGQIKHSPLPEEPDSLNKERPNQAKNSKAQTKLSLVPPLSEPKPGVQVYIKTLLRQKRIGKSQKGLIVDQKSE